MELRTLCTDFGASITGMWPFDELSCEIELGVLVPNVRLVSPEQHFLDISTYERNQDTSGWQLQLVRLLERTLPVYGDDPNKPIGECDLTYQLTLRRNSAFYMHVFVTPLVLVHVLLMASFWCPGISVVRVALCGLSVTVTVVVLLASGPYTPNGYVPTLMRYYEWTLYMSWLACVLFVLDRQLERIVVRAEDSVAETADDSETTWLERILNRRWVRMAFGMNTVSVFLTFEYHHVRFPIKTPFVPCAFFAVI